MDTILITGGTGFLGRALAKHFNKDYNVILGGRNNANNQTASEQTGCMAVPLDITNVNSINDVLDEVHPKIIIHAAATKYVDLSERFPMECIDVNILGSQNVIRTAISKGVDTVIGISTDKAAPPVGNLYGHTKAIMERMFCSMNNHVNTNILCVRFGNIAWSTGSVFPIWYKMVKTKGKISTTGPHMRRFLFSVQDAVQLVDKALSNSVELAGGILSLKMKSAQILDVLVQFAALHNVSWEQVDPRPGDKIDEVLIGQLELRHTKEIVIDHNKYYFINFLKYFTNHISSEVNTLDAEKLRPDEIARLITLNSEELS